MAGCLKRDSWKRCFKNLNPFSHFTLNEMSIVCIIFGLNIALEQKVEGFRMANLDLNVPRSTEVPEFRRLVPEHAAFCPLRVAHKKPSGVRCINN